MALTFLDIKNEVKRRGTQDQSGTEFDATIGNIVNTSLFRLSREAAWRQLRRKDTITTKTSYTTGTGNVSVTNGSKAVTITGATLQTDNIEIGRRIDLGGSSKNYTIVTITGETTLTVDIDYDGTTSTTESYKIYGKEDYTLPPQVSHRMFLWHEEYGYPYVMDYLTDQDFLKAGRDILTENIPFAYRMWGEDMILEQPLEGSVMRIASSDSADTSKKITIFGTVSGYPDFEQISTDGSDGTTAVSGSKSFTKVERVVKDSSTTGRITVDSNSANVTIAVIPVGDTTAGILYKHVQLFPLPSSVFPINCQFYKDPWRLVNDEDTHELGQEFDESIILLSSAKIKMNTNIKEGKDLLGLYGDEIRSLKRTNADKLDYFPALRRPRESRPTPVRLHRHVSFAQLGGSFGPIVRP